MMDLDHSSLAAAVQQTVDQIRSGAGEETLRVTGFSGAELFREEAKRNALERAKTFTIHRNIIVKRVTEESDGATRQVYLVTVRSGRFGGQDAFYWRFVEDGHAKVRRNKTVSKKTGRVVGWKTHRAREAKYWAKQAAKLENGSATVPAYPFMRPAYESKKQEAVDVMTRTLAEQIARNSKKS
ncbi:HK97 gp10 family phage protein [Telluria beijingensis]|uniref:HK97 gp10 family phage protein n=1 Tax=Telluria beijingensis TaxID=3068633 RepID=UPI00279562E1|nr:hypothetical protein [Massilia sp. REN29]